MADIVTDIPFTEIELVIKIPENTYRQIQALAKNGYFEHDICGNSMQRIANGTPPPKKQERALTNSEWVDFLSKQFDVSRTSAKDMLHAMMSIKKEDNFKKQFSGAKLKDPEAPTIEDAEEDTER